MLLTVDAVDVFYGDVQALHDVSIAVAEGEICAIVGANGAGKSTLIQALSAILPVRRGEILLEGKPLHRLRPHQVVELGIIQVPEGRRVFPQMTILENLLLGAHNHRAKPHQAETLSHVYELFPKLADRRYQLAGSLSGGEQQMLAIGRGLMARPRLLMLDEPSLGLAPMLVQQVFSVVRSIKEQGTTVLLIEQHVGHALRLADRGYVLQNGRVVMAGTGAELMADSQLREAYLGIH